MSDTGQTREYEEDERVIAGGEPFGTKPVQSKTESKNYVDWLAECTPDELTKHAEEFASQAGINVNWLQSQLLVSEFITRWPAAIAEVKRLEASHDEIHRRLSESVCERQRLEAENAKLRGMIESAWRAWDKTTELDSVMHEIDKMIGEDRKLVQP